MARDLPDWHTLTAQTTVHEVTDVGEAAVRLGSVVSHDRRGDVIWIDEFECELNKWITLEPGTGAAVALSSTYARNGAQSVKMTGGTNPLHGAKITHYLAMPVATSLGFEFSFMLDTKPRLIDVVIVVFDGVNNSSYRIYWDGDTNTLYYYDAADSPQVLATDINFAVNDTLFHTWKMVIDLTELEYERLILNNVELTMARIGAWNVADSSLANVAVSVNVFSNSGDNDIAYIDDVILTVNEPVEA